MSQSFREWFAAKAQAILDDRRRKFAILEPLLIRDAKKDLSRAAEKLNEGDWKASTRFLNAAQGALEAVAYWRWYCHLDAT